MTHTLKGDAKTLKVHLDGEFLDVKESMKYRVHADEFNWGYGGSGPAQLALAITLKLGVGSEISYQDFKYKIIGRLPQGEDFEVEFDYETKTITKWIVPKTEPIH